LTNSRIRHWYNFLDFLSEVGSMDYNKLIICGYSLGAHIAGIAGKHVSRGRVGAIIGLDPAGPLFSMNKPGDRLDEHDAIFVASIHTNGGRLGIGNRISQADFFVNGGSSQPGCNCQLN
jgi:pancreatic triacylglycerol lipase